MAEADPLMDDALQREPDDGRTNLIAARLAAKKGEAVQAESFIIGPFTASGRITRGRGE